MGSYQPRRRRRANREGSIYFVPSEDRWRGALTWIDASGRQQRRTISAKSQAEVRRRLATLRADLDHGMEPAKAGSTGSYLAGWLERERQRVRPSTWRQRDQVIRAQLTPALGSIPLDKLAPSDVERMTGQLVASGRSPRTASHAGPSCAEHSPMPSATAWSIATSPPWLDPLASLVAPSNRDAITWTPISSAACWPWEPSTASARWSLSRPPPAFARASS
jgi:hypothetical protein